MAYKWGGYTSTNDWYDLVSAGKIIFLEPDGNNYSCNSATGSFQIPFTVPCIIRIVSGIEVRTYKVFQGW